MKKLILTVSCLFPMAVWAQHPQKLPTELVGRWDAAGRQCDSENSGIRGVFNSLFGKKPVPCIEKELAAADLTRRGWCPEEVATTPETTVTVWKNCRPAHLLFTPLESARDAETDDIVRDYWFSLDNSVYEEENGHRQAYEFYSARMNEDADELEKRGYCYHGDATDRKEKLVPCTKEELARRKLANVQDKRPAVTKKAAEKTVTK